MTWFPRRPPPPRVRPNSKIPLDDYEEVTWRVMCGETLQSVANDYGVTRERIRQITVLHGIHPSELRYARKQMLVRQNAEEIIYHLEAWHPIQWASYGFTRLDFEKHLSFDDYWEYDNLWARYVTAWPNPTATQCCPGGRVCARCRVWFPWDNFYADRTGPNGKSQSCIPCAKFIVKSYHDARYVPEPTVTERVCPRCKALKPASDYWRNTHNNTGLQTYCKECQHKMVEASKK